MAVTDPSQALSISLANLLLECLCGAVAERPNPPQHCCFRIGVQATADADLYSDICCEGLAYVIPGDTWPTVQFPNQDITRQANSTPCGILSWAMEFRAGIMRCSPTGTDTTAPTCDDYNAAALQSLYDAESLRRAVCCFQPQALALPQMDGLSIVVGRQQQGPEQGGCIERWMTVQVQLPGDCCNPAPTPTVL